MKNEGIIMGEVGMDNNGQPENIKPPNKGQLKDPVSGSEGTVSSEDALLKSKRRGENHPPRVHPPLTGKGGVEEGDSGSKETGGSKEAPWERVIRERHSRRTLSPLTGKGGVEGSDIPNADPGKVEAEAKMDPAEEMLIKWEKLLGNTELGKNIRFANELLFHPEDFHHDDLEAILRFETGVPGEGGQSEVMNIIDIGQGLINEFRNGKLLGRRGFQLLKGAERLRKQFNASGKKGSDWDVLTGDKVEDRSVKLAQKALDALEQGENIENIAENIDAGQLREEMGLSEQQVKDLASQLVGEPAPIDGGKGEHDGGGASSGQTGGEAGAGPASIGGGGVPPAAPLGGGEGSPPGRVTPQDRDDLLKRGADWLKNREWKELGLKLGTWALILMFIYLGAMGGMARFLERNAERTRAQVQNV